MPAQTDAPAEPTETDAARHRPAPEGSEIYKPPLGGAPAVAAAAATRRAKIRVAAPVGRRDPAETRTRAFLRGRVLRAAVAALMVTAAAFAVIAPFAEATVPAQSWSFAYVPVLGLVMLSGVLGLFLYTSARDARERAEE